MCLWRVSLGCVTGVCLSGEFSGVCLWSVSLESFSGVCHWGVSLGCFDSSYGLLLVLAPMRGIWRERHGCPKTASRSFNLADLPPPPTGLEARRPKQDSRLENGRGRRSAPENGTTRSTQKRLSLPSSQRALCSTSAGRGTPGEAHPTEPGKTAHLSGRVGGRTADEPGHTILCSCASSSLAEIH